MEKLISEAKIQGQIRNAHQRSSIVSGYLVVSGTDALPRSIYGIDRRLIRWIFQNKLA